MALTNANDLDLAQNMQNNISSSPQQRGVEVASSVNIPTNMRVSPTTVDKNIEPNIAEEVGLDEIEAIQDPEQAELEGATEIDAPMLEEGYEYQQRIAEFNAEKERMGAGITPLGPRPPIVTAQQGTSLPPQTLSQQQMNAIDSAEATLRDKYKDDLLSYAKVFGEGVATGSLELLPTLGYQGTRIIPASLEVVYNVGANVGGRLYNAAISIIDKFSK